MEDNRPIGEIFGGTLLPAKRLADEEGATVKDALAAMEDADQDVEKARALLRERDQVDTPQKRRAERQQIIDNLKERKHGWLAGAQKLIAEDEARIAELEEEQRRDV